jgi:formylglycine-generating enzyme required for sulfatase activity
VKDHIPSTPPPEQPGPNALLEQSTPEDQAGTEDSVENSRVNRQHSDPEYTESSRARTATLLKKYFQRAKRRKRWLKAAGIIGAFFILFSGIGTWLWNKDLSFRVAVLRAVSTVASIHVKPEMVMVPAGTFQQGDLHGDDNPSEQPRREVRIKKFAMGRFEVTFQEYDRFAIATGRTLPRDEGWGRDTRPVINVSWEDASEYAKWLSQETGRRYRLPTESEWEYAARNRGKGDIWAGTSDKEQLQRYAWFDETSSGKTQPVGTKLPNGLGLHDMSGNVWEWVKDCWHDDYSEAPVDGSAWLDTNGGNCEMRLRRGGAWTNPPLSLRASFRNWYSADTRSILIGFRLAQDID